jgi:thiamine-phosphate pyrophosphorylase
MDPRLVRWARAVKARQMRRGRGGVPPLWLFTDATRLPDPRAAVAALPRGLCGVVLRHDGAPERAALGRQLAALCRARHLALVVAGDGRLARALGAGLHLRGGRRPGVPVLPGGRGRGITSSAHGPAELRRARLSGAAAAFLSPAFATASHPDARPLGAVRWARAARGAGFPVLALGGITAATARALPRDLCAGAGAIGALLPPRHSVSQ